MPDSAGSLEIRAVADADLPRAIEIDAEYVGVGEQKLRAWRAMRPGWLRGAYLNGQLVGICCGEEKNGAVVLQSIGVLVEHWRRGIGSRLLRHFEETVFADAAIARISLGSAADRPTEAFYLKNGYRATSIRLSIPADAAALPAEAPDPDRIRDDGTERSLDFSIDRYEPDKRDALAAQFSATQGIFIFEKTKPTTA